MENILPNYDLTLKMFCLIFLSLGAIVFLWFLKHTELYPISMLKHKSLLIVHRFVLIGYLAWDAVDKPRIPAPGLTENWIKAVESLGYEHDL